MRLHILIISVALYMRIVWGRIERKKEEEGEGKGGFYRCGGGGWGSGSGREERRVRAGSYELN